MTKKRFSKLLSVILALAICATTVFGCLITANAATPCYAWSDGKVADDGQTATINLTITAPDGVFDAGFLVGKFELAQDAALTPESVTVVDGTSASGSFDVGNVTANLEGNVCDFYNNVGWEDSFKTLVFKITYNAAFEKGKEYAVNVTSMELADYWDKYPEKAPGKAGVIKWGCDHVVSVDGLTRVATGNGYSVYKNAVCAKCGENIGYQLVPTETLKTEPNVIYNNGTYDRSFLDNAAEGVGDTAENPYIIKTVAQLHALVRGSTYEKVTGKYFKIDPSIDVICLQNSSYIGDINEFLAKDADAVKSHLSNGTNRQTWWSNPDANSTGTTSPISFNGHIDFSGAAIVGMYNTQGGLFEKVGPNATFDNFEIKNCYVTAVDAGTLFGFTDSSYDSTNGTIQIKNAEFSNCYVESKGKNDYRVGAVAGLLRSNKGISMTNVAIYNNITTFTNTETAADPVNRYGAIGTVWTNVNGSDETEDVYFQFENIIAIGSSPFWSNATTAEGQSSKWDQMNNVYTNITDPRPYYYNGEYITNYDGKFNVISSDAASGLNALDLNGLDFVNTWHFDSNGGYPSPVKTEDVATVSQSALNLKAVNLTYATDGTFDINFYYEPVAELADIITTKVCVGVADGSALYEAQGAVLSDVDCETLGLNEGALCYTIGNIPARKIGDLMLPTVVAKNVGTTIWGATKQLSVADYAKAVISGEGIYYPDNATEEQKAQDKAVAAAVINYGAAAKNALAVTSTGVTKNVIYLTSDYNTPESVTFAGSGTEAEPYIIDTVGKLRALAQSKIEAAQNTAGKFYKIADGISTICLQTQSYIDANGGLDKFMAKSADEIKDLFETNTSGRTNWNSAGDAFAGTIDFNGATVVGAYGVHGGLFEKIAVGSTIKNLTLANNYFTNSDFTNSSNVGSVAAYIQNPSAAGTATFESIIIKNNALVSTNSSAALERTGVLVGYAAYGNIGLKYSNLLTYGNKATGGNIGADVALVGAMNASTDGRGTANPNGDFNTSVILDCVPYQINSTNNQTTRKEYWHSIYTNGNIDDYKANSWAENSALDITKLSEEDVAKIKGEAADKHSVLAKLDFDTAWITGYPGEYPTPAQKGITTDTALNVIYGVGEPDGTFMDGSHGTGKESDPYIISTAAQLRALVQGNTDNTKVANTRGKYFKIADGIDIICLQNSSYIGDIHEFLAKSADEVKTFLSNDTNRSRWQASGGPFDGTLDFNGATIVGLYNENGGLFADVGPNANLKNFKIKNSYITTGWYAGTIFGRALPYRYKSTDEDAKDGYKYVTEGTVVIENAEVSNCFVETKAGNDTAQNVGAMFGMTYQPGGSTDPLSVKVCGITAKIGVSVENAILYGNKAMHYNTVSTNYNERNCLMGSVLTNLKQAEETENLYYQFDKIIAIDCLPYMANANNTQAMVTDENNFTNVYTNKFGTNDVKPYYHESSKSVNNSNYATKTDATYDGHINQISADDIKGANAKTVMANLGWAEDGSGPWYVGNAWGYPSFEKASVMPEAYQSAYDNLALDSYITYGDSTAQFGLYAGAVNLMTNPSIGFTFAFADNYKTNRDEINIKITNADGTVTYYEGNPPAYDGSEIVNQNGWTNKTKAGRYHLLKLDGSVGTVVAAKDLCNDVKITMEYNDKTVNATFNLKGLAKEYEDAYKLTGSNYYLVRAEAIKAVIYYAQMLEARYS